jgi:hypothetical protein
MMIKMMSLLCNLGMQGIEGGVVHSHLNIFLLFAFFEAKILFNMGANHLFVSLYFCHEVR